MEKRKSTWCIYALLVFFLGSFAVETISAKEAISREEELALKGGWGGRDRRSLVPAVSANIIDDILFVTFRDPSPDVTITITNGDAVVEQITISTTTAMFSEYINISNYTPGIYSIDISNLSGGHLWGEFIIE